MTEDDLKVIEARVFKHYKRDVGIGADVLALVAEVRRLRANIDSLRTTREVCSLDIEEGAIQTASERLFDAVDALIDKAPARLQYAYKPEDVQRAIRIGHMGGLSRERAAPERCPARESGGVQCELPAGHKGAHACPEALARREKSFGEAFRESQTSTALGVKRLHEIARARDVWGGTCIHCLEPLKWAGKSDYLPCPCTR